MKNNSPRLVFLKILFINVKSVWDKN